MTRRSKRSTLFPYTTLFRSQIVWSACERVYLAQMEEKLQLPQMVGLVLSWKGTDRKSTRLNSSHRCISYAVFCLKKKMSTFANAYSAQQRWEVAFVGITLRV